MKIGDRIRNLRNDLEITLSELGKEIGVSKQTIQRYETGEITNIPSDKIELIAKALKTSPAYLMGWEEKNEGEDLYYVSEDKQNIIKALDKLSADDLKFVVSMIEKLNK